MRTVPLGPGFSGWMRIGQRNRSTTTRSGWSRIAGTTEYGMVDPIEKLSKIALAHDLFFHVDAAFGGMVIPFLDKPVPFDFSLPGVTTIAVDPHKMGLSTIPAGCLLTREPVLLNALNIDTPYLTVKQEFTLAGTRPGAPVVGALAVLDYLGMEGMQAIISGCMKNTRRLIAGMETFGIQRAATPDVNVATFSARRCLTIGRCLGPAKGTFVSSRCPTYTGTGSRFLSRRLVKCMLDRLVESLETCPMVKRGELQLFHPPDHRRRSCR